MEYEPADGECRMRPPINRIPLLAEHRAIQKRRSAWFQGKDALHGTENLLGLGLSGGGIRSASFCLGALQALDAFGLIKRADYLSTVSGGGYIGTGMVASMTRHAREHLDDAAAKTGVTTAEPTAPPYFFPYGRAQGDQGVAGADPGSNSIQDNAFVGHVRDHSKFLIPHGVSDIILSMGVLARGLAVNFFLILMVIVPLAAITIATNPTQAHLKRSVILDILASWCGRIDWYCPPILQQFLLSAAWGLLLLVYLILWGIWRSCLERDARVRSGLDAVPHAGTICAQFLGIQLVVTFALEVQGPILHWLAEKLQESKATQQTLPTLYVALVSFVGATAALRSKLVGLIEKALADPGMGAFVKASISRLLLLAAGLIVPFLVYTAYLGLSLWGIAATPRVEPDHMLSRLVRLWHTFFTPPVCQGDCKPPEPTPFLFGPDWVDDKCILLVLCIALAAVLIRHLLVLVATGSGRQVMILFARRLKNLGLKGWGVVAAIFGLLAFISYAAMVTRTGVSAGPLEHMAAGSDGASIVLWNYAVASTLVILSAFLFSPNANSLHSLYRDRLSVAFRLGKTREVNTDPMRLTALTDYAPYLLVNATLNARVAARTQNRNRGGSSNLQDCSQRWTDDDANQREMEASSRQVTPDPVKRGRNADFFHFSRDYIGSGSTRYARTSCMEGADASLSLAAAAAISGAAFTSNMGRANIDALSPTLALLNIRLGYWLSNPKYCHRPTRCLPPDLPWHDFFRAYLFAEAFGLLRTDSSKIYVTDGGHVDNLGLYQLLRRKCGVIVIIDAEADPAMHFGALVDVERFARIDLGYRIRIDFTGMQAAAARRKTDKDHAGKGSHVDDIDPVHADHFAIGTIDYGKNEEGVLIYLKALVTGDEPDYVLDYERRYPSFPHESTGDQFFSEEQMEAYRALGFHAVERALSTQITPSWAGSMSPEKRFAVERAFEALAKIRQVKRGLGISTETLGD